MPDEPVFVVENRAGLEVLIRRVRQLDDAQLAHPMAAGWTVAAVLCHLAFWDLRALDLIQAWEAKGAGPSAMDTDIINEAMRELLLAIPPRAAVELAVDSAARVERAIAGLSPARVADIESHGGAVRLNRSLHWRGHLDEIEQALG
jgi:hypothetical protein